MKRIITVCLVILMAVAGCFAIGSSKVSAASAGKKYMKIDSEGFSGSKPSRKGKAGKYYFWLKWGKERNNESYAYLWYSKTKNGKGKILAKDVIMPYDAEVVTNGRYVFYRYSGKKLNLFKRKDIKTGKVKKFKIPNVSYGDYHVYGDNIYILKGGKKVIKYNIKSKKQSKMKAAGKMKGINCMIGKNGILYFFCTPGNKVKVYRYDLKKGKLKIVKTANLPQVDGREYADYTLYFEAEPGGRHGSYQYNFLTNKLKKIN